MKKFKTIFLEEAVEFIGSLSEQARNKIFYNIDKVEGGIKSNDLFKKLEGSDIWEFRTLYNGIQYRLFAFWDTEAEALVVATHGIVKKVWKVPSKEIAKAETLREEYFKSK
ncbi:MAG: type II toxin-antitoxin system RelE/ParE family toxin [Bacteroidaceae bacterium]|nr:type II toxin-antitoxin system RelE/ParE family toxin [Bacteroidaceae bacterium]